MTAAAWECPIRSHHAVEMDGDAICCTYPGCLRRSDDVGRDSCECEVYDCAGGCCGGQCSCTIDTGVTS